MILAGDIGGTKVNLALYEAGGRGLECRVIETYPSRDYSSLREIVKLFLEAHSAKVDCACFGIAGPVRNGRAQPTNLSWIADVRELITLLNLEKVWLINDLEANAYGIQELAPDKLVELNRGSGINGNLAIISAGTGLGEAGLLWDGRRHLVIPSEGGHSDFGPRTDLDVELLGYFRARFGQVSWEHVLSGAGSFHIYQFLRDSGRGTEPAWLAEEMKQNDPAAVITKAALENKCGLCVQALDLFTRYYGAEAANLALKMFAIGGVYVGGGIAPKIIEKIKDGTFMKAFIGEGRMKDLLATIPVRVILDDKTALIGAAHYAAAQSGKIS
ncbi:MAG TPA: glucokinase [Verrucomicrobiae bacterium]|nr:glucokinase [Verrucomicrobiae bacterium]